jgi:uncharacterized protein YeaO (DUF488 family)
MTPRRAAMGIGFSSSDCGRRGIRKTELPTDEWITELGPSTELRKWFSHDPAR